MSRIRKAVFPVAGLGTRFLPATKANPKEMLPVVDKPMIQYAVNEAVAAGINTLVFITGRTKRAIADDFERAPELDMELQERGKHDLLNTMYEAVPSNVECVYIRQGEAFGLGHAVYCARSVIGDEPFAVLLADDLIDGVNPQGVLADMVATAERESASVLGVERVPEEHTHRYGVIGPGASNGRVHDVTAIVEKPSPGEAPSNLAVVGRYILDGSIFELIAKTGPGAGGEIQLTDAISKLLQTQRVVGYEFAGKRYDCGSKLGYLEAQLAYGLKHPELGADFRQKLLEVAAELTRAETAPV